MSTVAQKDGNREEIGKLFTGFQKHPEAAAV